MRVGCPIRRSRGQSLLAAHPGFSQRATSFIASWRQGIHQMPFSFKDARSGGTRVPPLILSPPRTGATATRTAPDKTASLMKTLLPLDGLLAVSCQLLADNRQRRPVQVTQNFSLHHVKERTGPLARAGDVVASPDPRLRPFKARRQLVGGGERNRTDDLLLAKQALSQLSYTPAMQTISSALNQLVGQGGFEPPTSRLSSARSNQLSY